MELDENLELDEDNDEKTVNSTNETESFSEEAVNDSMEIVSNEYEELETTDSIYTIYKVLICIFLH